MPGLPEFRKSQGIVPFGVGAIVDFPAESLMAAGLDMWPSEQSDVDPAWRKDVIAATEIFDARLQARLSVGRSPRISRFLTPLEAPDRSNRFANAADPTLVTGFMPFVRFPEWHFCPRCRLLWRVPWNTPLRDERLRCTGKRRHRHGGGTTCHDLPTRSRPRLAPVRFVAACNRGHIMDFPWVAWAHKGRKCPQGLSSGDVFLISTGQAGLLGVSVRCGCGARQHLGRALGPCALDDCWPSRCPGERPWLGPDATQTCDVAPRTVQRGASNTYFANIATSILIPPYSESVRQVVETSRIWQFLLGVRGPDGDVPSNVAKFIAQEHGLDAQILADAIREKLDRDGASDSTPESDEEYLHAEYRAFLGSRPVRQDRRDFDITPIPIEHYEKWFSRFFEQVVLVPRLRETRVHTGFTRLEPSHSQSDDRVAALSIVNKPWLPGIDVRGEGIFIVLRESALETWEGVPAAQHARTSILVARYRRYLADRGLEPQVVTNRLLLIHTLAHILIRQLTFDCGYDSSSLRERLYVSRDRTSGMNGLLIYTASGDAEGTLGGLVRQGRPGRLETTVSAALQNAALCSSDPLCIESEGQGGNGLNLAACHACALLPETACEFGNSLLDRGLVIGTGEESDVGYFQECAWDCDDHID